MPCPLFIPSLSLGGMVSIPAPLGDLFDGTCAAGEGPIDVETLRAHCNFGYARGKCERAARSDADAARFLVKAHRGGVVEIAWSVERNHHPVAVGTMEIDTTTETTATDVLTRQANACAAAYIRQTYTEPPPPRIPVAAHR